MGSKLALTQQREEGQRTMENVSRRLAQRIARHWNRTPSEIVEVTTTPRLYWVRFGDGERVCGAIRHLGK